MRLCTIVVLTCAPGGWRTLKYATLIRTIVVLTCAPNWRTLKYATPHRCRILTCAPGGWRRLKYATLHHCRTQMWSWWLADIKICNCAPLSYSHVLLVAGGRLTVRPSQQTASPHFVVSVTEKKNNYGATT